MKYRYNISDPALDTEYQGEGRWRGYALETFGNNLKELCSNALISEVDEDGEEIITYGLLDSDKAVFNEVIIIIKNVLAKAKLN